MALYPWLYTVRYTDFSGVSAHKAQLINCMPISENLERLFVDQFNRLIGNDLDRRGCCEPASEKT